MFSCTGAQGWVIPIPPPTISIAVSHNLPVHFLHYLICMRVSNNMRRLFGSSPELAQIIADPDSQRLALHTLAEHSQPPLRGMPPRPGFRSINPDNSFSLLFFILAGLSRIWTDNSITIFPLPLICTLFSIPWQLLWPISWTSLIQTTASLLIGFPASALQSPCSAHLLATNVPLLS